jgi:hypothetical protein
MKWIGYLLIGAVLIALITSPSERKFKSFIYGQTDTAACKPVIIHKSFGIFSLRLFSIGTAIECKKISGTESIKILRRKNIGVLGKQEKYLGLFGKFWKL